MSIAIINFKNCNLTNNIVRAVVPLTPHMARMPLYIDNQPIDIFGCTKNSRGNFDTFEVVFPANLTNTTYNLVSGPPIQQQSLDISQLASYSNFLQSQLILKDQDGTQYILNIADMQSDVIKHGRWIQTTKRWALIPGTKIGVHIYVTARSDDLVRIGLRISNGNIEQDGSGVAGKFYLSKLSLKIAPNFVLKEDFERPYYDIEPNDDGSTTFVLFREAQHVFLKQQGWVREFVFASRNREQEAGLIAAKYDTGFVVDGGQFSWQRNKSFLTQKTVLGKITNDFVNWYGVHGYDGYINNLIADHLIPVQNTIRIGAQDPPRKFFFPAMGSFHPHFDQQEGQVGGDGIIHFDGYTLRVEELQLLTLLAHANIDRHRWYMYSSDGKSMTIQRFAAQFNNLIPWEYVGNAGQDLPYFLAAGSANMGTCPYELTLAHYQKHDFSHLIRITRYLKTLAQFTNDPLYKDELEMAAENCHLQYHEYPHVYNGWSFGADLLTLYNLAHNNPGRGSNILVRSFVWPLDAINANYLFANNQWRSNNLPALRLAVDFLKEASMPTGWVQNHWWPPTTTNINAPYMTAQTFEEEFLDYLRNGLARSVFANKDLPRYFELLQQIIKSTTNTHFGGLPNQHPNGSYSPNRFAGVENLNTHAISIRFNPPAIGGGDESFYGWHQIYVAILAAQELGQDEKVNDLTNRLLLLKELKNEVVSYLMHEAREYWNDHLPNAIGLVGFIQNDDS